MLRGGRGRGQTFWHPDQRRVTALHVEATITRITEQHILLHGQQDTCHLTAPYTHAVLCSTELQLLVGTVS